MIYIKYSGSIKKGQIKKLQEEFVDIARISGWDYEIISEDFYTFTTKTKRNIPTKEEILSIEGDTEGLSTLNSSDVYLEGIVLRIDDRIEPLRFTFDKQGKLATISLVATDTKGLNKKLVVKKYEFLHYPFVKVYSHDVDKHKQVVTILDYLKKKYIKDLEVIDTSFYWDNRDEEELKVRLWKSSKDRKIII